MRLSIQKEIRLETSSFGDAQRRALSTDNVWTWYIDAFYRKCGILIFDYLNMKY